MVENLQRVENRVQDFDRRLQSVEQEVKDDAELNELRNEVSGLLPKTEDEIVEAEHQEQKPGEMAPENCALSGRARNIAMALNEEAYRVQDAQDQLQEETHRVQTVEMAGDTRYYKEE